MEESGGRGRRLEEVEMRCRDLESLNLDLQDQLDQRATQVEVAQGNLEEARAIILDLERDSRSLKKEL